ncbi:insulinase family protein [Kaistella anthropi]|nr:insulinase family protein [Kaistella anthropi]
MQEEIDNNKKVTRDQITAFYHNLMGANDGLGTVLGSIDAKTTANSLEKTFGKFTAKTKYSEVKPTYFETKKLDKNFITPDKENAVALGTEKFRMDQNILIMQLWYWPMKSWEVEVSFLQDFR